MIKELNNCNVIDVSIPADRIILTKEAENFLKYKSLAIEAQRMWQNNISVNPIVIGAKGYFNKTDYMGKLTGNSILQKPAILGTALILRKVLT